MMARSTTRSNLRPDTLMQDRRRQFDEIFLQRTAGPYIGSQIGIGGSLAAPPLPHHRTYGSVYGGSRSYANALRSNDSTRVGWAFGFMHHRERFDVFPQRLPGFTRRRR